MAIIIICLIFAIENNTIDRKKNEINLTDYCMKLYRLIFVGKAFMLLASIYFIVWCHLHFNRFAQRDFIHDIYSHTHPVDLSKS